MAVRINDIGYWWGDKVKHAPKVGDMLHMEPYSPYVADGHECRLRHLKRICLAPTVEQCFLGIGGWSARTYIEVDEISRSARRLRSGFWAQFNFDYYVLEPVPGTRIVSADMRYIPDAYETDELWVLEPGDFIVVGTIEWGWRAVDNSDPVEWRWVEKIKGGI